MPGARKIFNTVNSKDLVLCNTMLLGLLQSGRDKEALRMFQRMIKHGIQPDRITLWSIICVQLQKCVAAAFSKILEACIIQGNLCMAEFIEEKMLDLKSQSSLPYTVLVQTYGAKCKWEKMARVLRLMEDQEAVKVVMQLAVYQEPCPCIYI
jgi:pentatricopeptide repeat protein